MIRRGRIKAGTAANGAQSWRELEGIKKPPRRTKWVWLRRLRNLLKASLLFSPVLALVAAGIWYWQESGKGRHASNTLPRAQPIEKILFKSNGVLPEQWLSQTLEIKSGTSLMDTDIHHLKYRLEQFGQVRSATVERIFPNALRISIEEHNPVLRMATQVNGGAVEQRLVSEEGTVYRGLGYKQSRLKKLPYVRPYLHDDGNYLPFSGISRVAELLKLADQKYPQLYRDWEVISLEHYSGNTEFSGEVIEVRTKLVPRIIFSPGMDFDRQLNRLVYILGKVKERGNPSMERIDLSLRSLAAVQFSSSKVGNFQ